MPGSVLFDHQRVIHGNVSGPLIEFGHRIAARSHDFLNQLICFSESASGIVNKSRLDLVPTRDKPCSGLRWQRSYLELLDSLLQLLQLRFRAHFAAGFFDRPAVLGTEALSKSFAAHNR